jgi:IS1 family transposase
MKEKTVPAELKGTGVGDIWTWTALDADSKLMVSYLVGDRSGATAKVFMEDVAARLTNRVQLTTDGHSAYLQAVEDAFGSEVDYAQLVKIYGPEIGSEKRYSPAACLGSEKVVIKGSPDEALISTSYVERQNLTMRMSMRRFTRLTNAFSKKAENHGYAVALHFMWYNFGRIHRTLRVTPAMEAGLTDHVWTLEEIAALAD